MKRFLLFCLSFALFACSENEVSQQTTVAPSVNALSCNDEITNLNTPADMYPALSECVNQNNYEKGVTLLMVAGAYTYFDFQRISNPSAQEASQVLQMNSLSQLPEKAMMSFMKELNQFRKSPESMKGLCAYLAKLGMPKYNPNYMMQADQEDTNQQGVDTKGLKLDEIWQSTLTDFLKCS